jgi:anaerobic magnesium-protoporphyrin IX monomethyl ester cyclase
MKIMIVTTPLRPIPTAYPPMGSLSLCNYLRKNGVRDVKFYNIDSNRPSYEEALAHIIAQKPSILGISAVVSTSYAYTKQMSLDVKKALPETLVVVGGNLAASAEILLRKTGTDICVLGEGEKTLLKIVKRAQQTRDLNEYVDIPGLAMIDPDGALINTGYETPLANDEIYDVDWQDLAKSSDITRFIYDPYEADQALSWLLHDPRAHEPHRQGKKVVELHAAKGCVARCTFCHRFDKGIRYIPVDLLRERIRVLTDQYNIGYLVIADENFGTDRRWLTEFCEMIGEFDLLWRVAGMRVNCISPEQIQIMKSVGCVSIIYGMETGSPSMLKIMEKKTTVEQNCNAMKWTIEAGLYSIIQLVIGMPGESSKTIKETIEFCKYGLTLDQSQNSNNLSINYAQALPGTPLYEFARRRGMIGYSLDDEEAYLLNISDKNAHDEISQLNFTDYPALEAHTWRPRITIETNYAYVKKFGLAYYHQVLLNDTNYFTSARTENGRFANPQRLIDASIATDTLHGTKDRMTLTGSQSLPSLISLIKNGKLGMAIICYPILAYYIRHFIILLGIFKNIRRLSARKNTSLIARYLRHYFNLGKWSKKSDANWKSLRKIVMDDFPKPIDDSPAMAPLRKGR